MAAYDPLDPDADCFRPPRISTLVGRLHCREEYDSYRIEWRIMTDNEGRPHGFWCCPIENCDGKGFGFDIFPVDPDDRDEDGNKMWTDDGDEDEDEFDLDLDDEPGTKDISNPASDGKRNDDEELPW